ncbi:MAG: subclass B3 metallo-beta-lactamase [Rhodoblastus sp.]|nr:subclass B3 metallo-beta-lactamase [Rhodoblastus sp.]
MKKIALLATFFALMATPAPAQSLKDFLAQLRKKWDAPTEPFRVVDNVYYVGTQGLAAYLVTSPQGHVLIDTVMPGNTATTTTAIEKLGFKVVDIKLMLNTHAHLDHTGGFAEIKAASGAQMVAGEKDKPLLESGTYPGRESVEELKFPPVKVDRAVVDGDVVSLGPIKLVAHATPGHSPGCTTWTMAVKDNGADHGVIFFCSATVALNRLVGAPTHPGIVEDYRRTLTTAGAIKGDILLAPHPEMFGMDAKRAALAQGVASGAPNPFIKPDEFQAYLVKLKVDFDAGLAKQQAQTKK